MSEASENGSVTNWIHALKGGDRDATRPLWERYFTRLVRLANSKLGSAKHTGIIEDGEDAALSAFGSLFEGIELGKFAEVADREDLWQLLVVITARKAFDQVERARAQKRGGGKVVGEGALSGGDDDRPGGLDTLAADGASPEAAAMVLEECHRLLAALPDDETREIAIWKMEGYTKQEIADRLGCSPRTVSYRLRDIRDTWEAATP